MCVRSVSICTVVQVKQVNCTCAALALLDIDDDNSIDVHGIQTLARASRACKPWKETGLKRTLTVVGLIFQTSIPQ